MRLDAKIGVTCSCDRIIDRDGTVTRCVKGRSSSTIEIDATRRTAKGYRRCRDRRGVGDRDRIISCRHAVIGVVGVTFKEDGAEACGDVLVDIDSLVRIHGYAGSVSEGGGDVIEGHCPAIAGGIEDDCRSKGRAHCAFRQTTGCDLALMCRANVECPCRDLVEFDIAELERTGSCGDIRRASVDHDVVGDGV